MPREVLADKQYVVKITGLLPRTPYGLYDEIRVSEPSKYDARYVQCAVCSGFGHLTDDPLFLLCCLLR